MTTWSKGDDPRTDRDHPSKGEVPRTVYDHLAEVTTNPRTRLSIRHSQRRRVLLNIDIGGHVSMVGNVRHGTFWTSTLAATCPTSSHVRSGTLRVLLGQRHGRCSDRVWCFGFCSCCCVAHHHQESRRRLVPEPPRRFLVAVLFVLFFLVQMILLVGFSSRRSCRQVETTLSSRRCSCVEFVLWLASTCLRQMVSRCFVSCAMGQERQVRLTSLRSVALDCPGIRLHVDDGSVNPVSRRGCFYRRWQGR